MKILPPLDVSGADAADGAPPGHDRLAALRRAVGTDELRLAFQPKVTLADERMVGVEALLRWSSPELGSISPNDFIPLAEEHGLIVPIGQWVLEEACRQGHRWRMASPGTAPLSVAVNVSARQLGAPLVDTVAAVLAESAFDAALLCVEVTETAVMEDIDSAVAILRAIKALGVKVSVDDFGTGYSSLAYLKRLPADELKVDKSFIDGLGQDPDATAIVAAVVASAHALGLVVVAEGVESPRHVTSLQRLGCELAQGFHYSRPVPASAIDGLIAGDRRLGSRDGRAEESSGWSVLVVDDAADVRQLAHMSLAAVGYEVHEAETGRAALDEAARHRPDCVVLDLNLPDISGLDVCRELRRREATRDCTIVMLTADAGAQGKVEAFSIGVDEYIVKPFGPRDLVGRIRSAMRQRAEIHLAHVADRR